MFLFRMNETYVVAVDAEEKEFVEIYLEVVPMTVAAVHVDDVATMDCADGHDSVSYAAIGDFPTMTSEIDALKRVVVFAMDCPTWCHKLMSMLVEMSLDHCIVDWYDHDHHSCCYYHYVPNPIWYQCEAHYATVMVQFAIEQKSEETIS